MIKKTAAILALSLTLFQLGFSQFYTFTGNGNWSTSTNWLNSIIPPSNLPAGSTIYISPKPGDSCVLNIAQIILPGAQLVISTGAIFIVPGSVNNTPVTNICDQLWTKKNLEVTHYKNGDSIPQVTDPATWYSLATGAWCYPDNDSALGAVYGKIYNWHAVNDPRGLAPKGWHIPSQAEWLSLAACLGGGSIAGGALKDTGTVYWYEPNNGATNSSGFTALPGGLLPGLFYYGDRFFGNWWGATENISGQPTYARIYSDSVSMQIDNLVGDNNRPKIQGMSVRCVFGALPDLSTTAISKQASTSGVSGGNIVDDGGTRVTQRGIVWNDKPGPTVVYPTKTINGAGIGNFTSSITGLFPIMNYHVRAYATNSAGTAYGNDYSFTTSVAENFPADTAICGKVWMTRNLTVSRYRNGDAIPEVKDRAKWAALTSGAWCWYNNDSIAYGAIYGKLYNWYAVNDPRGLAPEGWHVPSDSEWVDLEDCQGGGNLAAANLKEAGTHHWVANDGATNSSGFTGLPGTITNSDGSFTGPGEDGHWWSKKESYAGQSYIFVLRSNPSTSALHAQLISAEKNRGASVRCIKN